MLSAQIPAAKIPAAKTWTGQFRIGRQASREPGFRALPGIGGWQVSAAESCPTQAIIDRAGRPIGYLIGIAIDHQGGKLQEGRLRMDWPADATAREAAIEQAIYKFGGSWACVFAVDGFERVYLDADGTLSLVYDPAQQAAASTAGLLLDDDAYRARFNTGLYTTLDVPGEGWFPSGLTAHSGVKRLLCNHYLDLSTFEPCRHWPTREFTHAGDLEASAARVAEIVRKQAEALLNRGRVVVALTGGNETRFLLAAYKPIIKDLTFVTVEAPATVRDVVIASNLAEKFGLKHFLLPVQEATEAERAAWHYATGHCVSGPNMVTHPTIRPLARDYDFFLGGLGGEIGRAFFWRPTDTPETQIGSAELLPRFGMPPAAEVADATEQWLEGVAGYDAYTKLDLAYLELRMSAWSAAQTYAQAFVNHLHPLITREIYALMLDLPPDAKRGNLLIKTAIRQSWPELGGIPINRFGDYRDMLHTMLRASDHKRVAKKLRKLFG